MSTEKPSSPVVDENPVENAAPVTAASGETADNATYKPGPLTRDDYEDTFQRADKFTDLQLREEQQAMMENVVDDRRAELHHLCVDAAIKAWDPSRPPFIDAHFSMWTITTDVYDGSLNPPKANAKPWNCCHPMGEHQARCAGQKAVNILRRDYTSDNYEEELEAMRLQAEAELQDGIGELSPIRYGIHVPVTPSYTENALISTLAEEYYFIAGYISWADLVDPLLVDRLGYLSKDPLLVGLRYDMTQMANELILDNTTDVNFAAIEYYGLPYELLIRPDQLKYACHIAYRHPNMKFILNHCAIPTDYCSVMNPNSQMFSNWLSDLQYLSRYPNVFCKLTGTTGWCNKTNYYTQKLIPNEGLVAAYSSGSEDDDNKSEKSSGGEDELIYDVKNDFRATNVMTQAINFFGPDRCIFGSGWPVSRAVIPEQTGWKECGIRRQLTSKIVDRGKSTKARKMQHECLDLWETCRLVEHCLEEAGLGSVDDKYKVFAKNAASVYKLTIRPYGANNLDA